VRPSYTPGQGEHVIFEQDRRIVESQRSEQLPSDLAAERHVKVDSVAIAHRRAMQALDLA
jgi:hypothetical protein